MSLPFPRRSASAVPPRRAAVRIVSVIRANATWRQSRRKTFQVTSASWSRGLRGLACGVWSMRGGTTAENSCISTGRNKLPPLAIVLVVFVRSRCPQDITTAPASGPIQATSQAIYKAGITISAKGSWRVCQKTTWKHCTIRCTTAREALVCRCNRTVPVAFVRSQACSVVVCFVGDDNDTRHVCIISNQHRPRGIAGRVFRMAKCQAGREMEHPHHAA